MDTEGEERIIGLHAPVYIEEKVAAQIVADLKRKALNVRFELDEFTAAEKLAYEVLKENGYAS